MSDSKINFLMLRRLTPIQLVVSDKLHSPDMLKPAVTKWVKTRILGRRIYMCSAGSRTATGSLLINQLSSTLVVDLFIT